MNKTIICASLVLMIAAVTGCKAPEAEGDKAKPEAEPAAAKADPATPKKAPAPAAPAVPEEKFSASHILVMYKGAAKAPADITRTKEEAEALAKKVHEELKAGGDFGELARKHSDCPSKAQGGDLGTFPSKMMAPEFTAGVKSTPVGEYSAPVESPFGYHLIKRQELMKSVDLSALVIIILHKDSVPNPISATRTKEEALAMADEAIGKLKGGADFAEVAKEYSDHPNKEAGGEMGNFKSDQIPADLARAVMSLEIGQLSPAPVEIPIGYHIIKRKDLLESVPMAASLILVMHKDSKPNPINATRTKEEALARAKEVLGKLEKGGNFEDLAKEYSDHPNRANGGQMGVFKSDQMTPMIVKALKAIEVDQHTKEPLDISIGFHVLKRNDPAKVPPRPQMMPPMPGGGGPRPPMPGGPGGGSPRPPMPAPHQH